MSEKLKEESTSLPDAFAFAVKRLVVNPITRIARFNVYKTESPVLVCLKFSPRFL
jgi:hypothetical protein